MKFPCLRALALPVLCWLALLSARAEEVTISLGMSYDKVIEAVQKCGGQDITHETQATGYYWWLERYGIRVFLGEHYGKLNFLSYSGGVERPPEINGSLPQTVQSLTFDTDKKTFISGPLPPAPAAVQEGGRWIVRTEVLFVTLPSDKALPLLPDLRDEDKIAAAYGQIMAAIQRKEAKLIGYPVTYAPSGQKVTTETIFEKIYPTQFDPPQEPQTVGIAPPHESGRDAVPTAFDKRNVGVTLEMEPIVSADGKWIDVALQQQHVEFDGMDTYEFQKGLNANGKVEQPRFYTNKDNFSITVRNGQRVLIGVHKSQHTDEIELHIMQVTVAQVP